MATILLRIFPQQSHHNATFALGNSLKKRGHRVVYAATGGMKASIEGNGFDFFEIKEQDDCFPLPTAVRTKRNIYRTVKNYLDGRVFVNSCGKLLEEKDFFHDLITKVGPDLILIDGVMKFFSLQLTRYKVPYCFIETTVSTVKYGNIPPLCSSFVPGDGILSRGVALLQWKWYHHSLRPTLKKVLGNYAGKINYPLHEIDFSRYFMPGFKQIPEINMSPCEFDYDHPSPANHFHVSPVKLDTRQEIACDWGYRSVIASIAKTDKKVIFCSFGTMAWRYPRHETFIRRLVLAFEKEAAFELIICIENDRLRREILKNRPDHIHVFKKVPQIELLSNLADVMIHHGGMNSITECILTDTPMLVCPGERWLDQYGNAGRVKFHHIGVQGSFSDSSRTIFENINYLVNSERVRSSLLDLHQKILRDDHSAKGLEFIESLLKTNNKQNV